MARLGGSSLQIHPTSCWELISSRKTRSSRTSLSSSISMVWAADEQFYSIGEMRPKVACKHVYVTGRVRGTLSGPWVSCEQLRAALSSSRSGGETTCSFAHWPATVTALAQLPPSPSVGGWLQCWSRMQQRALWSSRHVAVRAWSRLGWGQVVPRSNFITAGANEITWSAMRVVTARPRDRACDTPPRLSVSHSSGQL